MLEDFIKYIIGEWRMISQAPVSFIVAVLVTGAIIWWAMTWGYGREMSLLSQQVADYKDKLSGASPDQAKARIDNLESRLVRIEPRRLTDNQRQALIARARVPNYEHHDLNLSFEGGCPDCPTFAASLEGALREAGWNVRNAMVIGPGKRPVRGIAMIIPDPDNLSKDASILQSALHAVQIEVELIQRSALPGMSPIELLITSPST